jgi:glucose/mannose-6-phosphate isomerase
LASIDSLKDQVTDAWQEAGRIQIPDTFLNFTKVLMTGMGGSGLGARIIESVFAGKIKVPLVRLNDYRLPAWVDSETLVICSSFSGTTEETICNAREAQARGAKWLAISTGGPLIELAKTHQVPYYQINPTYNPSKQPRLAIGYSVIGQLALVSKTGLIPLSQQDIGIITAALQTVVNQNNFQVPESQNPAKQLASELANRLTIFVTSRHLVGAVHTVKNQMNENSKHFAALFEIPELNHHLMEGLAHPKDNSSHLAFMFIKSPLFEEVILKRHTITQDIVSKHQIPVYEWTATAKHELAEAFEYIQFGAYVNLYLNLIYGIDPAPIKWVDYFKTQLGQSLGQWK